MKKLFASMLVFSALAITGCSGSTTDSTPPAETTPPPAEEGAGTETPADDTTAEPTNP
jgi:hypothetical protein